MKDLYCYPTAFRKILNAFLILVLFSSISQVHAQNVTVNPGAGSYATLKEAFDAINAGTHTGNIAVSIVGNTTETSSAVLNASGSGLASYTTISITPSGARTVTGAITAGSSLIDLNGADSVIFNGLNTGGNNLTISNTTVSATSGTSTIRFRADASRNRVMNCTILGAATMAVGTNGGNIFISTGTVTGNDSITISNNLIGQVGTNLPSKGVYGNGSATNANIGNSNVIISNNRFADIFAEGVSSAGVYTSGGCNNWSISNNSFYQTDARAWTAGVQHSAIWITPTTVTTGAQGFSITGNIIGYASPSQTSTYTLSASSTARFYAIYYAGLSGGQVTTISGNTIAAISFTNMSASSQTNASAPLVGIYVAGGEVTANNNIIGSQSVNGSFSYSGSANSDVFPFLINGGTNLSFSASGNIIGGISAANSATGTANIAAFRNNTATSFSVNNNTIGGTTANSIQSNSANTGTSIIGILNTAGTGTHTFNGNTIRNITTLGGNADVTSNAVSIAGIFSSPAGMVNAGMNTIYNLTSTGADAKLVGISMAGGVSTVISDNTIYAITGFGAGTAAAYGISISGGTEHRVFRNKIYNISEAGAIVAAVPAVVGLSLSAGTTDSVYNNIIGNLSALSSSGTDVIRGISITSTFASSTYSVFYNTLYLNASTSGTIFGTSGLYHTASATATTALLDLRNNIIVNESSALGTGLTVAFRRSGPNMENYATTSNTNLFFAGSPSPANLIYYDGINADQTLAAFKTRVAPRESGSVTEMPPFVSTTGSDPAFLHITATPTTQVSNRATPISTITTDFDGNTRSMLTPDIGADEIADPLPVSLILFKGEAAGNANRLSWITATETNNRGFELERSVDGRAFSSIGFVASKAMNGTSTAASNYGFTDEKPFAGDSYYRLKQVDKDGRFSYSGVILLSRKVATITLSSLYPNPTRSGLNLVITSPNTEKISMVITGINGKVLMQRTMQLVVGSNQTVLDVEPLAAGTYFIKISSSNGWEKISSFVKQ